MTRPLDWFHIAMRFQNVRGAVDDAFKGTLEGVKWKLWHGRSDEALRKLELLMSHVTDTKKRLQLKQLHEYLESNQAYLVNYAERDHQNLS